MPKKVQESFTRQQIARIAIAYSNGNYIHSDFTNQFYASQHTFYTILHLAVDKRIVSEKIAKQIQKTAVTNSVQKAKADGFSKDYISRIESKIFNSWQRRIEAARSFKFSKKEAKTLVTNYSKTDISFNAFCQKNCIEHELFRSTIVNAIIYNWVDDECFDKLYVKALLEGDSEKVEHLFYQLTKRRKENKASKKK